MLLCWPGLLVDANWWRVVMRRFALKLRKPVSIGCDWSAVITARCARRYAAELVAEQSSYLRGVVVGSVDWPPVWPNTEIEH